MERGDERAGVTFYKVLPTARSPRRADRTLEGSIPARAQRFCEPVKAATGFGWHIYCPADIELLWDGATIHWRVLDQPRWEPLRLAHIPGLPELLKTTASVPASMHEQPPFLAAFPDRPGFIQVWSGIYMRTAPGWSTLVRGPANFPTPAGYDVLEGIIETDWWMGPVLSQIRMTRTEIPVRLYRSSPLFQVQPVHRSAYAAEHLQDFTVVDGAPNFSAEDWQGISAALDPRNVERERPGWYQRQVRRRRAAEGSTSDEVLSPPGT